MTLLQKIQNLKWTPDLPYKLKDALLELNNKNIQQNSKGQYATNIDAIAGGLVAGDLYNLPPINGNKPLALVFNPLFINGAKVMILGDSTLSAYNCRTTSIAEELFTVQENTNGYQAFTLAFPGSSINQQLTAWNADTNKLNYDIIIVQVGLNDIEPNINTTLTNYQNLITAINSGKKSGAKVVVSCMTPARARFEQIPITDGYSKWLQLNNAIMTTITGVDVRNNYHVALLNDGNGNLATQYDCGDLIHENQDGADIIITGFRNIIFSF